MKRIVIGIAIIVGLAVLLRPSSIVAFVLVAVGVACIVKFGRWFKEWFINSSAVHMFNKGASYAMNLNLLTAAILSMEKQDSDRIFKDVTEGIIEYMSILNDAIAKMPKQFTGGFVRMLEQISDAMALYEESEKERDRIFEYDKFILETDDKVQVIDFRQRICMDRIDFITGLVSSKEFLKSKKRVDKDIIESIKRFYDKLEKLR